MGELVTWNGGLGLRGCSSRRFSSCSTRSRSSANLRGSRGGGAGASGGRCSITENNWPIAFGVSGASSSSPRNFHLFAAGVSPGDTGASAAGAGAAASAAGAWRRSAAGAGAGALAGATLERGARSAPTARSCPHGFRFFARSRAGVRGLERVVDDDDDQPAEEEGDLPAAADIGEHLENVLAPHFEACGACGSYGR